MIKRKDTEVKRRKNQEGWWTDKTTYAVERYIKWKSKPHIQTRIYHEHIEIPLRNISRRNIKTSLYFGKGEKLFDYNPYKETSYETEIENLVDECVSFFFTTLLPYVENGKIKNIFGYINSSMRHNLLQVNIERSHGMVDWKPLPSDEFEDTKIYRNGIELPKIVGSDLTVDEIDYINHMLSYWDKNIDLIWKRKDQQLSRDVASNVLELFRRSHKIKYFKVDSMRRYLRKMMNWGTGEHVYKSSKRNIFNKVIWFMRDRNKLLKTQYEKRGMIDYYYI